jgi:tRNA-2-methylthio-N6-dimethylallyladenosine synthase
MKPLCGQKFRIHTFGCQMNENDSEHIAGILRALGAAPAESLASSHIIIVNTCAVRQKSEEKLYSLLGRLRELKNEALSLLVVTGCVAQLHHSEILKKFPFVDFILGPDNYWRLPDVLAETHHPRRSYSGRDNRWHEIHPVERRHRHSGFITIMEGCSNFCAYCVVPYTRGAEKYRPQKYILSEARNMISQGYREIILLGQNVNSYVDPVSGGSFAELLKQTAGLENMAWLRFITSHPKDFDQSAAEAMRDFPCLCRQLHLPVQSGSTRILKAMNRRYSREHYLDTVAMLKETMPKISLSTDIIVGFPGEEQSDFDLTMDLLDKVRYTNIFSFKYSPRPGTAAYGWKNNISPEIKKHRLIQLQSRQKSIQLEDNRKLIGTRMTVLCTGRSKKDNTVFAGRNEAYQVVNFTSGQDTTGRFVMVEITSAGPYSLRGRLIA